MSAAKLALRLTGLLYPYHFWVWRQALRSQPLLTEWNREHEAIFVHIPKTAGTSVFAGLGARTAFDSHAPIGVYRRTDPAFYAQAYKFTVVRDPWDRFASSFHFFKQGTTWKLQQDWARAHIGDLDFRAFTRRLREPLFRAQVMSERFFWPQTFWLRDQGRLDRDVEVFRFEALDAALATICRRLGISQPATTPHLRRVDRPQSEALYDEETRAIVGRLYRNDVAAFGYARPAIIEGPGPLLARGLLMGSKALGEPPLTG